jgi:hypothetical protein
MKELTQHFIYEETEAQRGKRPAQSPTALPHPEQKLEPRLPDTNPCFHPRPLWELSKPPPPQPLLVVMSVLCGEGDRFPWGCLAPGGDHCGASARESSQQVPRPLMQLWEEVEPVAQSPMWGGGQGQNPW